MDEKAMRDEFDRKFARNSFSAYEIAAMWDGFRAGVDAALSKKAKAPGCGCCDPCETKKTAAPKATLAQSHIHTRQDEKQPSENIQLYNQIESKGMKP